ncbi:MAG: T9SS type A sorting domain-containing protein [Chitinophagales bacterium]|nr:T9SS type A sorting domain-containing protein [Chitinophagales bacterium]
MLGLGISTPSAQAQLENGTIAPDFTLTDLNGNSHNLYSYLNQGKIVVLDMFATWCTTCWNYAPKIKEAYQLHGPNGDNTMVFLALEADSQTDDNLQNPSGVAGNWIASTPFPIINQTGSVNDDYEINYYPTLYMICPSKEAYEFGMVPSSQYAGIAAANCAGVFGVNNASVTYIGEKEYQNCSAFTPKATIQNLGTNNLTSLKLEAIYDGQLEQTINWTGNLATLSAADITFNPIEQKKAAKLEIQASLPNNVADDANNNNKITEDIVFRSSTKQLTLNLHTDKWGPQDSWRIYNEQGTVVAKNEGYLDCETTYVENIVLDVDGCYKFQLTDGLGNGMFNGPVNPASHNCTNGDPSYTEGSVELKDDQGTIIWDRIDFGKKVDVFFYASSTPLGYNFSVDVDKNTNIVVTPVPAREQLSVQFNNSISQTINLEVVNILGQTVLALSKDYAAGNNQEYLNLSNLADGTYILRMSDAKANSKSVRFIVAK